MSIQEKIMNTKQKEINTQNVTRLLDGLYNLGYSVDDYENVVKAEYLGVYEYVAVIYHKLGESWDKLIKYLALTGLIDFEDDFWVDYKRIELSAMNEQIYG